MKRFAILLFGLGSYLYFLAVFLYAIGFVGNFAVPTTIDGPVTVSTTQAMLTNLGLLAIFALQHSLMSRIWFKQWWTQIVPKPAERSVYVLCSNVALTLLFWLWEPMGGTVWNVTAPWARVALYVLFGSGWLTVLVTTLLINHFDLFGLRQVWLYFRGQPYRPVPFVTPGPYRIVRHPMYVGWLLAFWATPTMTLAHLVFALGTTAYILTAIYFEERDLVKLLGTDYAQYRHRVPMMVPRLFSSQRDREPQPTLSE